MRVFYRRKRRRENTPLFASLARWLGALCATAYLAWLLLFPGRSGAFGEVLAETLFNLLGAAAYLLPVFLAYALILWFYSLKWGYRTWGLGGILSLLSAAMIAGALGSLTGDDPPWGGAIGAALYRYLAGILGAVGAWLIAVTCGLLGLRTLFGISWWDAASRLSRALTQDYREWLEARRALSEKIKAAAGNLGSPMDGRWNPEGTSAVSQALTAGSSATPMILHPAQAVSFIPNSKSLQEEAAQKQTSSYSSSEGKNRAKGTLDRTTINRFVLPPLQLLNPKPAGTSSGPDELEIRSAVENLDRTLASFGIEARVGDLSPGPVITRYEVAPAPGVTVSSIVARANDIALAMKARGIRMIAPIPGKAAIGIEIPNQKPAGVTLREVLESPAMIQRKAPLAFAMGLSSDGTPVASDLQALPHLLVAGATNSGKSVMMHALILSILLRSRPDEVKLILIDPKRIELSLYEGIPHLYDPKIPCEQVRVVTHSKDAARSLKALIAIMESRYEKFQAYRVRDINAFNREAQKRGEPAEFHIVVVIDELADLMVVAREVVEDSIQRLAQMARAVGIHLVLATQRPSVDVITGVIKANLPARIALRVASKVDSKVILDLNGAETLMGRGDMLYMAPGLEPVRIQGAYVSTEEIGLVVEHLKTQGKPDYPLFRTMATVGEEDLRQHGVEPIEFREALDLVLQRRRVSQDLLKSQFGSSARATNLLSLLEVKGFIHKPEGTNRWEIYFDRIEDYLGPRGAAAAPQSGSGDALA